MRSSEKIFIIFILYCARARTRAHTHTHTYIYIYIYIKRNLLQVLATSHLGLLGIKAVFGNMVKTAFPKNLKFLLFFLKINCFLFMFSNHFDVLMSIIFKKLKNIILMYIRPKNTLNRNHYHILKHLLSISYQPPD